MNPDDGAIYRHRRACYGFGAVVEQVGERWERPSPCPEWDARDVLEHVIGFHEVLLFRPLGIKANRPRDDSRSMGGHPTGHLHRPRCQLVPSRPPTRRLDARSGFPPPYAHH